MDGIPVVWNEKKSSVSPKAWSIRHNSPDNWNAELCLPMNWGGSNSIQSIPPCWNIDPSIPSGWGTENSIPSAWRISDDIRYYNTLSGGLTPAVYQDAFAGKRADSELIADAAKGLGILAMNAAGRAVEYARSDEAKEKLYNARDKAISIAGKVGSVTKSAAEAAVDYARSDEFKEKVDSAKGKAATVAVKAGTAISDIKNRTGERINDIRTSRSRKTVTGTEEQEAFSDYSPDYVYNENPVEYAEYEQNPYTESADTPLLSDSEFTDETAPAEFGQNYALSTDNISDESLFMSDTDIYDNPLVENDTDYQETAAESETVDSSFLSEPEYSENDEYVKADSSDLHYQEKVNHNAVNNATAQNSSIKQQRTSDQYNNRPTAARMQAAGNPARYSQNTGYQPNMNQNYQQNYYRNDAAQRVNAGYYPPPAQNPQYYYSNQQYQNQENNRNTTILLAIIAGMLALCVILGGILLMQYKNEDNNAAQPPADSKRTAAEEKAVKNDTPETVDLKSMIPEITACYKAIINEKIAYMQENQWNDSVSYSLFDMDNDSIPELLITYGFGHAGRQSEAYTYKNNSISMMSGDRFAGDISYGSDRSTGQLVTIHCYQSSVMMDWFIVDQSGNIVRTDSSNAENIENYDTYIAEQRIDRLGLSYIKWSSDDSDYSTYIGTDYYSGAYYPGISFKFLVDKLSEYMDN